MTRLTTRTQSVEEGFSWWRGLIPLLLGQLPESVERSSLWVVVFRDGEEIGRFRVGLFSSADKYQKIVADAAERFDDEQFDTWLEDCMRLGKPVLRK